jgi:hypothetical protein
MFSYLHWLLLSYTVEACYLTNTGCCFQMEIYNLTNTGFHVEVCYRCSYLCTVSTVYSRLLRVFSALFVFHIFYHNSLCNSNCFNLWYHNIIFQIIPVHPGIILQIIYATCLCKQSSCGNLRNMLCHNFCKCIFCTVLIKLFMSKISLSEYRNATVILLVI